MDYGIINTTTYYNIHINKLCILQYYKILPGIPSNPGGPGGPISPGGPDIEAQSPGGTTPKPQDM